MSDVLFKLFLWLGVGIALTQFLVAWQLIIFQGEIHNATRSREAIYGEQTKSHNEILERARVIIDRQDRLLDALHHLEGRK